MRGLLSQLKRAKILLLPLGLAAYYWIRTHTGLRTADDFDLLFAQAIPYAVAGLLLVLFLVLIHKFSARASAFKKPSPPPSTVSSERRVPDAIAARSVGAGRTETLAPPTTRGTSLQVETTFKSNPQDFDGATVLLFGRVERVVRSKFWDGLRRRFEIFKAIMKGVLPNYTKTEKFLISSPQLKKGQLLLVLHTIDSQRLPIERGMWVETRGRYQHRPVQRLFGLLGTTFYGRIRSADSTHCYVRKIINRPDNLDRLPVGIVTLAREDELPESAQSFARFGR